MLEADQTLTVAACPQMTQTGSSALPSLLRHTCLLKAIEQALQRGFVHADETAADEANRKRRLEVDGFCDGRPRLAYLPRFRQCRAEIHVGQEAGVRDPLYGKDMISVQATACTENQGFPYIPDLPLKRNAPPERGEV